MNNELGHRLFTAKDINRILGINAKTLYHWVQTRNLMTPKIVGVGRGAKHKYSLENLATLSLIQVLNNLRMELFGVKLLSVLLASPKNKSESLLWNTYKNRREDWKKNGFFLSFGIPLKEKEESLIFNIGMRKEHKDMMERFKKKRSDQQKKFILGPLAGIIHIDLLVIIKNLEKETGLEL